MNQKPLVSIIVPVYNSETFLRRCVDSILCQEFRDFELLLIDDGSTDGSAGICDEYEKNDTRVRAVHKKNSGVSHSRNTALNMARGTYIQFLDSDDWITPNATKLLVRSMEEYHCDMVVSDFYRVAGERVAQKGDIEEDRPLTRQEFAAYMVENPADFYYGVLWNKMYKQEIIAKYRIRMDVTLDWCEDFLFNLEYMRHAHTFYALQVPVYYYVKRKGSLVSQGMSINNTLRMKISVFEYYNEFFKDVYDKDDYADIRPQVYSFFLAAAKDGMVLPVPLTGAKKLGMERNRVHKEAIFGDGIAADAYRYRKLMECHLDAIAKKNGLTLDETILMFHLAQPCHLTTLRDLADFSGLPVRKITPLLQKLEKKHLVEVETRKRREKKFLLQPASESLVKDFETIQEDFNQTRFRGLTDEEIANYRSLSEKTRNNIIHVLKNW